MISQAIFVRGSLRLVDTLNFGPSGLPSGRSILGPCFQYFRFAICDWNVKWYYQTARI